MRATTGVPARPDRLRAGLLEPRVLAGLSRRAARRLELRDVGADGEGAAARAPRGPRSGGPGPCVTGLHDLIRPAVHGHRHGVQLLRAVQDHRRDRSVTRHVDRLSHASLPGADQDRSRSPRSESGIGVGRRASTSRCTPNWSRQATTSPVRPLASGERLGSTSCPGGARRSSRGRDRRRGARPGTRSWNSNVDIPRRCSRM